VKIEKCPFCGGEATIDNAGGKYQAWCKHCCCIHMGEFYNTEADAIAAWNHRTDHIGETTEKMPLTLDELRQMDGEPVWVMHQDGSGARWGIVKDTEYGLCAVVDDDTAYWFTDVCGTIAYRSKPKEEV